MRNGVDASAARGAADAAARGRADEALRAARSGRTDEAAAAFERLLAGMLVREMRRALPEGFFGAGPGADTFEGWLDEHLGNAIADASSLGIEEAVRASLLRRSAPDERGGTR